LEDFIQSWDWYICQAEQKAQEESERLRQQEREQLAERRKNDLV
jgi:hypothetical protein